MNLEEAYKEMQTVQLYERKFDAKKAEQTLRDILKVYAQVKSVGLDKNIYKRWDGMWYTTYTTWFSSSDMEKMGLPTTLMIGK